jgi:hypothetical protein
VRSTITIKDVSTLFQLVAVVLVTLFFAGIAAPSFLRSEAAGSHRLTSGSLHTLTIAHIPFTYTFWNLAFAILGALFGVAAVLATSSPSRPGFIARIGRALYQMPRPQKKSASYISGLLMMWSVSDVPEPDLGEQDKVVSVLRAFPCAHTQAFEQDGVGLTPKPK